MLTSYLETVHLIERLHRYFLEVVKVDLERMAMRDINAVQAMILYSIGDEDITVGELTARGYYLGSNVSYNVKNMVENSYLIQERSIHDRRSIRVRLSDKGRALRTALQETFQRQVTSLEGASMVKSDLTTLNDHLKKMERFWASMVNYGVLIG